MSLDKSAVSAADQEFYAKHPERNGKPLQKGEPGYEALAKEWRGLYNDKKTAKPKPKPPKSSAPKNKPPEPEFNVGKENTTKASQDCPKPDKAKVKVRITMFFDGTNNNKHNIAAGPQTGWLDFFKGEDSSYGNGLTNIARLSDAWEGYKDTYDIFNSIYIEGIGTETGGGDSKIGSGLGIGSTGVEAKVERGMSELVGYIEKHEKTQFDEVEIESVELDIFGFSRGAAAARNFVWACLEHKEPSRKLVKRLKGANKFKTVGEVKFKFAGLFDTVSSFGRSFKDDVKQLHLDAISKAERVVHLTAADEHRKNFALTNINSVGAGKGVQIFLPGVHSDVGGSYRSGVGDDGLQLMDVDVLYMSASDYARFKEERDWLIASGWYLANEIEYPTGAFDGTTNELTVNRESVGEEYSYIPLMLMEKYASDPRYGLKFQNIPADYSIAGDTTLEKAKSEVESYVTQKAGPPPTSSGFSSKPADWFTHPAPCASKPFLKPLRHEHLHFSAYYGDIGMQPNFCETDPKEGGSSDHLQFNGHRERAIYDG